jgi:hypothetical protein
MVAMNNHLHVRFAPNRYRDVAARRTVATEAGTWRTPRLDGGAVLGNRLDGGIHQHDRAG